MVARALRSHWSRRVVAERFLVFIWLLQSVAEAVAEYDGVRSAAQQVSNVQQVEGAPATWPWGLGLVTLSPELRRPLLLMQPWQGLFGVVRCGLAHSGVSAEVAN